MNALRPIAYEFAGTTMTGWLADGSAGKPAPGILVAHEGPGVTGHVKERATMLAKLGYVAFALDLYGETDLPVERAQEIVRGLRADLPTFRGRVAAALGVLTGQPNVDRGRLAAIGFCFGGTAVIELARTGAPLAAVVGFHSGFIVGTPEDNRAINGKLLLCHGVDDPVVPAAPREAFIEELREAGVDWQLHLYGGVGHSFTNREIDAWNLPGFRYDAQADARSWQAMRNLFDEVFEA